VAASYARLSTDDARGEAVSLFGRSTEGGRFGVGATRADGLRLSTEPPVGRPFAATVSGGMADAGGAVQRADGALVGVVMGQGRDTGAGYVVLVDDPLVASWVDGVISAVAVELTEEPAVAPTTAQSTIHVATLTSGSGTLLADEPAPTAGEPLLETHDPVIDYLVSVGRYDEATNLLLGDPRDYPVQKGGANWWGAYLPSDPAFAGDGAFAARHREAGFIITHGHPGQLGRVPDVRTIKALYAQSQGALVIDACYAGAPYQGLNNARRIADAALVQRDSVYGCTGEVGMSPSADALLCNGRWVDGNERPIPHNAALRNCVFKMAPGGREGKLVSCD
jgi:hypothetical protein